MSNQIKTANRHIQESCTIEGNKIILNGCKEVNEFYLAVEKFNPSFDESQNSFNSFFCSGDKILYKLTHYVDKKPVYAEFGSGKVETGYIDRIDTSYGILYQDNPCPVLYPRMYSQPNGKSDFLEVSLYFPSNSFELLRFPNCTIASSSNSLPYNVNVEKNTVLGRMDGEIGSFCISTLISSLTRVLRLKVSKLFSRVLETHKVIIKKTSIEKKPITGSLIFDVEDNKLKFYNGEKWIVLGEVNEDT